MQKEYHFLFWDKKSPNVVPICPWTEGRSCILVKSETLLDVRLYTVTQSVIRWLSTISSKALDHFFEGCQSFVRRFLINSLKDLYKPFKGFIRVLKMICTNPFNDLSKMYVEVVEKVRRNGWGSIDEMFVRLGFPGSNDRSCWARRWIFRPKKTKEKPSPKQG